MVIEKIEHDLQNALETLRQGKLILYPTDTIWGIGCDATNMDAVNLIFNLKKRAESKSMISLVGSLSMLKQWVEVIPELALAEIQSNKVPLTIIYDSPVGLAHNLMADDGSAAFRIPRFQYTIELCKRLGKPIVSTSANISGTKAPKSFWDIDNTIIEGVNYVSEYGRSAKDHSPSRILKITNDNNKFIIRE